MKAVWCYDLHQPEPLFWESTPREFNALWKRHKESLEREAWPTVQMATYMSMYWNAHYKPERPPKDFIPITESAKPQTVSSGGPIADLCRMIAKPAENSATTPEQAEKVRRNAQKFLQ